MKKHSKPFKLLLALLLLVGIERFCRSQTEGFRLNKGVVHHRYPYEEKTAPPPAPLFQPFHFLGSGVQFYVFISEDKETILKLFKHHHMGPSIDTLKTLVPIPLLSTLIKKREKRMGHLFKSVQIAREQLQEETGVFYTHLSPTDNECGTLCLYDKLNICHKVDLDKTPFLLQKRGVPTSQHLDTLFRAKRKKEAFGAMHQLLALLDGQSKKGIKNKDLKILTNWGFREGAPLEIDVGSFHFRNRSTHPNPHKKTVLRAKLQLATWVKTHHPEYLQECREELGL